MKNVFKTIALIKMDINQMYNLLPIFIRADCRSTYAKRRKL